MSRKGKAVAIGGVVVAAAAAAFWLLASRTGTLPEILDSGPEPCPLTGVDARAGALVDRPAVAVKIENAPIAFPLSGLQKAEVVYEEVVEGGVTRFMAVYHCTDAARAGPVRSARVVDPAIMIPTTRILAFSGANRPVTEALAEHDVVTVTEASQAGAFERIERAGLASEHTLYVDTKAARRVGSKSFEDRPGTEFEFGDLEGGSRTARSITIDFSATTQVGYQWSGGKWKRLQGGEPFLDETGRQVAVDNVVVEVHDVVLSKTIVDPAGNPSVEIADVTGSGRAVLFRDGRAVVGRWKRTEVEGPVVFETRSGGKMVFAPGSVWIHLVPSGAGEVKGSFSYEG